LYLKTKAHYLEIARKLKFFEDSKFNEWRLNVESILPSILKKNLLIKPKYKPDYNLALPSNADQETG
jgi:hypothetical protein